MSEVSARNQSLQILRGDLAYEIPSLESLEGVSDVPAALEQIKPLHYAKLAQTIDLILGDMIDKRPKRPPDGFMQSDFFDYDDNPWSKLRSNTIKTVHETASRIRGKQPYKEAAAINKVIGTLDGNRFISLESQLMAGADTAASSMLTILRSIPSLVRFHGLDDDELALEQLARRSHGLALRLAMTCVNRMVAAQTILSGDEQRKTWSSIDHDLVPTHFKVVEEADVPALRYVSFLDLSVPAGYNNGPNYEEIPEATRLGDLECYQSVTIGCPVTLLKGRMQELWHWYIDVVKQKELWSLQPQASEVSVI